MFKKIYIEITNKCNLACSFCHGHSRIKKEMTAEEFKLIAKKVKPFGREFYLHVMGEPLSHSQLSEILEIAKAEGMPVNITTNGTLLEKAAPVIFKSGAVRKVSVSLHSLEGCGLENKTEDYISGCVKFAKECKENKVICVLRLWNLDNGDLKGQNAQNERILQLLECNFPKPWKESYNGQKLGEYMFLEWGKRFEWPDLSASDHGEKGFCYGLRNQIAVLCDGTVTPCCLDSNGIIGLGNIFENTLEEIINTERAIKIKEGFSKRKVVEELCRKCGYAERFKK